MIVPRVGCLRRRPPAPSSWTATRLDRRCHRWLDRLRQQLREGRRILRRSEWSRGYHHGDATITRIGGVFIYDYGWEELTAGERDCDGGYDSLTVAGEGGDTILVGSMSGSNVVCSSDDEGDDWSDTELGTAAAALRDRLCKLTDISDSRVALNRDDPDNGVLDQRRHAQRRVAAPAIPAAPSRRPGSPTWPTLQTGPLR